MRFEIVSCRDLQCVCCKCIISSFQDFTGYLKKLRKHYGMLGILHCLICCFELDSCGQYFRLFANHSMKAS